MGETEEKGVFRGGRGGRDHKSDEVEAGAVTNYCRLRGGKGIGRWWEARIGQAEDGRCPRCGEEEKIPDHIVFRSREIRRTRDVKGRDRRRWVKEEGMRWDALASKKWVRAEDTGQLDDLMEEFFRNIHHQIKKLRV